MLAGAALVRTAAADTILTNHNDSLTTMQLTTASVGQGVRPTVDQRGVNIDGSMRAGGGYAWMLAGNPFEAGAIGSRMGDLNLATGAYSPTDVDIALPAPGMSRVVIGRTFNGVQASASNGYQGYNWFQISQPEIAVFDGDGNREDTDLIYVIYGADRFLEFKRTAANVDTFRAVNGAAGVIEFDSSTTPDTYVWYDQRGTKTYFFGDDTSSDHADFQFWKIEDTADVSNVAYVGHPTNPATAVTDGYSGKKITKLFDGAGRRYCYTYDGGRLESVIVETDAGGGWGACDEETEVARVEYEYYVADEDHGLPGDLKLVRITTPLSDQADLLVRRKYYRYWKGYDGETEFGPAHSIKMVVGFEGTRRFDTFDDQVFSDQELYDASDNDLKAYSDAYFEYDSGEKRIGLAFMNGECGCGSSIDGEHVFTYATNGSFSPSSGYTVGWLNRVIVEPPSGGAWITQYFDECAQPLSRVLSDSDPSSATNIWATQVVRNAGGQVLEIHTPENKNSYTHSTGAFTSKASVGLVWYFDRLSSTDLEGFATGVRQKAGESSLSANAEYVRSTEYSTRSLNIDTSVNVTRPVVTKSRTFHTATNNPADSTKYDETEMVYSWWSSTNTLPQYVAMKQVETEEPIVLDTTNGSDAPTYRRIYIRKDGTVAFSESATGRFTYTEFTNGQVTERIEDAKTNSADFSDGDDVDDDPNGNFGLTETGDGWHRATTFTYDPQGRLTTQILNPSGTTTKPGDFVIGTKHESQWHYAKLADMRPVTYSIPRIGTYDGPVNASISNHANNIEDCYIIALAGGYTTDPPGDWTVAVAILPWDWRSTSIVSGNAATRLVRSEYNETGTRLLARRAYHNIPGGDWPGDPEDDFDLWTLAYDDVGRLETTTDPTGTITQNVYDVLGRVTSRHIGTIGDMTEIERLEYDGGAANGNSHLTERIADVDGDWVGTTGDQRTTTLYNDYRGRLISIVNLVAPHQVAAYDNLGRVTATASYSSSSGLDATSVPTTTTNRVGYNQTFYDARGQVWKGIRHAVNQSTGASADTLESLMWYDPDRRVIKVDGEQLTKTRYDRLGRTIQTFILANVDDDADDYTDVFDSTNMWAKLTGDKVLEEIQTAYRADTSGTTTRLDEVVIQAVISRLHGDTSTTGPLDETYDGGDGDPLSFDNADVLGRIQITGMWYDHLHRLVSTGAYGTNDATDNIADWGPWVVTSPPTPSDSILVTTTVYGEDGLVESVTNPRAKVTTYAYDGRGRVTATIGDDGGIEATTRYVYEYGQQRQIWVDLDGDGNQDADDQVTSYDYGTTKGSSPGDSNIATGHLLYSAVYPDSGGGSDVVTYAYNAQSEVMWMEDQAGNIIETDYDLVGREISRIASNIDAAFDSTVERIDTVYLARGLVDTITQYDATSSGTALDQVQYTYDTWGNVTKMNQDVDSSIGTSGRAAFATDYTYQKNTSGRNTIRRVSQVAGGVTITSTFSSTAGRLDADASRTTRADTNIGGASLQTCQYEYIGANHLVGMDLLPPDARWNYYEGAGGSDPYPDLDRFNRIDQSRWTSYKTSGTRNVIDLAIKHDRNSNIDLIEDLVNTAGLAGTGNGLFDVDYTMDGLDRVTGAKEGNWNGSSLNVPTREETWSLSITGNWTGQSWDANGDADTFDVGDFTLGTQAFNDANEWTSRQVSFGNGSGGYATTTYTPTYDPVGNQTDDGESYDYKYDVFGRLKEVRNRSNNNLVVEYAYNGLGHRTGWHYDADADNDVDGSDPQYWFLYDLNWRLCATYRGTDASAKERFVFHSAGLGGAGSASYIDSVIFRDKDANTSWTSASDGVLEQRYYYLQNWRADVSAVLTSAGSLVERVKYSSYGVPFGMPVGDINSDGVYDTTNDRNNIPGGTYDVRKDCELDNDCDAADVTHADNTAGGGTVTMGRGFLTMAGTANRKGYAGYEYEYATRASRHLSHVRHRVYDAGLGRWTRRDPIGYLGGLNLYGYAADSVVIGMDPSGLFQVAPGQQSIPGSGPNPGWTYPGGAAPNPGYQPGGGIGPGMTSPGGFAPSSPGSVGPGTGPGQTAPGGVAPGGPFNPGSSSLSPFTCMGANCSPTSGGGSQLPPACVSDGGGGGGGSPGGGPAGGGPSSGGGGGGGGSSGGPGGVYGDIYERWVKSGSLGGCAQGAAAALSACEAGAGGAIDNACISRASTVANECAGRLSNPDGYSDAWTTCVSDSVGILLGGSAGNAIVGAEAGYLAADAAASAAASRLKSYITTFEQLEHLAVLHSTKIRIGPAIKAGLKAGVVGAVVAGVVVGASCGIAVYGA